VLESTVGSISLGSLSVDSYEWKSWRALERVVGSVQSDYFEHLCLPLYCADADIGRYIDSQK
jgi:hypothetical protein